MTSKKHPCPVCGQFEFSMEDSFEICEICGWEDDVYQIDHPDETGANQLTLIEARNEFQKSHN